MPSQQAPTLLIVDDDPLDRELVLRGLKRAGLGIEIFTAANGLEALELLRGTEAREPLPQPCLVTLDWKMPRMNGPEFLDELRSDDRLRQSTVFVLTTSEDPNDRQVAYSYLVAGYIFKGPSGQGYAEVIELLDKFTNVVQFPLIK